MYLDFNKIFVNCGGSLYEYKNKPEAMSFFEDCINCSEGSERERYTTIYFDLKSNLNTTKRCFTDGSDHVYTSNIDPDKLDPLDEKELIKNFGVSKERLLYFKANNYLSKNHSRIFDRTFDRYENIQDLYDDYICNSKDSTFYIIKDDRIICIDDESSSSEYWMEEFPIEDFEYADKWLNNEIEYDDYLTEKNKTKEKDIDI